MSFNLPKGISEPHEFPHKTFYRPSAAVIALSILLYAHYAEATSASNVNMEWFFIGYWLGLHTVSGGLRKGSRSYLVFIVSVLYVVSKL